MSNRAELNLRARVVGLDPSTIQNDSVLRQRVVALEKNATTVAGANATTTLTSTGVALNNETITIGTRVYTFKTALTSASAVDEVLIGAAATNTLDNLKDAINRTSVVTTPGVGYGSGTTQNEQVVAGTKTATTLLLTTLYASLGNTIATTETLTNFSFTGAVLSGGLPKVVAANAADVAAVAGGQMV